MTEYQTPNDNAEKPISPPYVVGKIQQLIDGAIAPIMTAEEPSIYDDLEDAWSYLSANQKLRAIRHALNLSLRQAAQFIGVSHSALGQSERGHRKWRGRDAELARMYRDIAIDL